jgi:hypothetical protein
MKSAVGVKIITKKNDIRMGFEIFAKKEIKRDHLSESLLIDCRLRKKVKTKANMSEVQTPSINFKGQRYIIINKIAIKKIKNERGDATFTRNLSIGSNADIEAG